MITVTKHINNRYFTVEANKNGITKLDIVNKLDTKDNNDLLLPRENIQEYIDLLEAVMFEIDKESIKRDRL